MPWHLIFSPALQNCFILTTVKFHPEHVQSSRLLTTPSITVVSNRQHTFLHAISWLKRHVAYTFPDLRYVRCPFEYSSVPWHSSYNNSSAVSTKQLNTFGPSKLFCFTMPNFWIFNRECNTWRHNKAMHNIGICPFMRKVLGKWTTVTDYLLPLPLFSIRTKGMSTIFFNTHTWHLLNGW